METPNNEKGWYTKLMNETTTLASQFELEDEQQDAFCQFIERVAREQFKTGNKAGIIWRSRQIDNEQKQNKGTMTRAEAL